MENISNSELITNTKTEFSNLFLAKYNPDQFYLILQRYQLSPNFAIEETQSALLEALEETSSDAVKEQAVGAIANIAYNNPAGKTLFAIEETQSALLKILKETSSDAVKEQAARAIANIALSPAGKKLFTTEETKSALLKILKETSSDAVKEQVVVAIANIANSPAGQTLPSTPGTSPTKTAEKSNQVNSRKDCCMIP